MEFNDFVALLGEEFEFDTAGIEENTTFADIGFDEFDMIELVMSIEDKYMIEVPDEALAQIKTIGDFADYIKEKTE